MKGFVEIETVNKVTGERKRIAKQNLVTDALGIVTDALIGSGENAQNLMPIAQKVLGGIMLFKDPLESSSSNIVFPASNLLVACAGQEANTENSMRGSLNALESGRTGSGYVNTWDFSTSQANGTISAIALTHKDVAVSPYFNLLRTSNFANLGVNPFDFKDGYFYSVNSNGALYRKYIPYTSYKVGDSAVYGTQETLEDLEKSTSGVWYAGHDDYAYRVTITRSGSNAAFTVKKLKLSDFTETTSTFTIEGLTYDNSNDIRNVDAKVCGGKVYIAYKLNGRIYVLITQLNGQVIREIDTGEDSTATLAYPGVIPTQDADGCLIAFDQGGGVQYRNVFGQVTESGSYRFDEAYITNTNLRYYPSYYGTIVSGYTDGSAGIQSNYLGTIFNLDNPIEKNASTTMKIRYTLIDA